MSVDEKIGQLFVVPVYGESADTTDPRMTAENRKLYGVDTPAEVVQKYHVGGVIYFAWAGNLSSPVQIARLSNGLQRAAVEQRLAIPLQVSIDQEEGVVTRIGYPATVFPGNMALGATRSESYARRSAAVVGQELRAMGINTDYAPLVDVNTNPYNLADGARSYGSDPALVSSMGAAAVQGFQQDARIAATAKHFPGLGDTTVNTDFGSAVTNETLEQIRARDLPPFRAAIDGGVMSIMAAHIVAPALDSSRTPASLSRPIITGLLRGELGYDGVVVTDALSAEALSDVPAQERSVRALAAGSDQLLMPPDLARSEAAVKSAVRSGRISQQQLNTAVFRILRLKLRLGLFSDPYTSLEAARTVGSSAHRALAQETADRSITLLANERGLLPLQQVKGRKVLVTGWGDTTTSALARLLTDYGAAADRILTGSSPSQQAIDRAVRAASSSDLVLAVVSDAWNDRGQQSLVRRLIDTGRPVIVLAVGTPYDAAYFPKPAAFVASYSYQRVSLQAAVSAMFGEIAPTGRLPVAVPRAGNPESVLYPYGYGLHYR